MHPSKQKRRTEGVRITATRTAVGAAVDPAAVILPSTESQRLAVGPPSSPATAGKRARGRRTHGPSRRRRVDGGPAAEDTPPPPLLRGRGSAAAEHMVRFVPASDSAASAAAVRFVPAGGGGGGGGGGGRLVEEDGVVRGLCCASCINCSRDEVVK